MAMAGSPPATPPATPPAAPPATPPAVPPAANTPAAGAVAPWGADVNQVWMVDNKPWYEAFVPEGPTRDLLKSKNYANPLVLADSHYAANRMVNGNAIEIPGADAKPEAWQALYKKLGALEKPEAYVFKQADGFKADEGMVKFGQTMAHKLGLNPAQAQTMNDNWNAFVAEQNAATATKHQTENQAEADGVKAKWGADFDTNMAAGKRATQALYDLTKPEEKATFNKIEESIGAAAMLDLFARLGKLGGEGGLIGAGSNTGGDVNNPSSLTPDQAGAEIARLGGDAEFQKAYTDRNHPQHAAKVAHMQALYAAQAKAKPTA